MRPREAQTKSPPNIERLPTRRTDYYFFPPRNEDLWYRDDPTWSHWCDSFLRHLSHSHAASKKRNGPGTSGSPRTVWGTRPEASTSKPRERMMKNLCVRYAKTIVTICDYSCVKCWKNTVVFPLTASNRRESQMHGVCMSGVMLPRHLGNLERQHNCLEARIMPERQHILDYTGHF